MIDYNKTNILKAESKKAIQTFFRDSGDLTKMAVPAKLINPAVKVPKFTRDYDYSAGSKLRAPGAKPKQIRTSFKFHNIELVESAISQPIDIQDRQNLYMLGQQSITAFAIQNLVEGLVLDMHESLSTIYDTDSYFSVLDLTAAGSTKWDQAGATPRTDFDTLLGQFLTRLGKNPNTIIISRDIVSAIKSNVTDWTNFWANHPMPDRPEDQLRKYFGLNLVDQVIIPSTYKGTDGAYSEFYSNLFILTYIEPAGQGQVIGDLTANRSPIRMYFLDQLYDYMQPNPSNKSKGFISMPEGLLIKLWQYEDNGGYMSNIDAKCNWSLDVTNPYALTKIKNILT
jgi:hypothetical protein